MTSKKTKRGKRTSSYNLCWSKKNKCTSKKSLKTKKNIIKELKCHERYWRKIHGRNSYEDINGFSLEKLKKILKSARDNDNPLLKGWKKCGDNKSKKSKSPKKSPKKSKKKSKEVCSKQTTKKYTSRNSPPYPANKCCGKTKKGNDKSMYKSKKSGSSCKWSKKNGKSIKKSHRKQSKKNKKS